MKKILGVLAGLALLLVLVTPASAQRTLTSTQLTTAHNCSTPYYPIGTRAFNTDKTDTLGFRELVYVKMYAGKAGAAIVKGSCLYDTLAMYNVSISPAALATTYDSTGTSADSTVIGFVAPRVAGTAYAAATSGYYGWMAVKGGAWVKTEAVLLDAQASPVGAAGAGGSFSNGRFLAGTPLCSNIGVPQLAKIARWAPQATFVEYKTYARQQANQLAVFGRIMRTYNDSTTLVKAFIDCR